MTKLNKILGVLSAALLLALVPVAHAQTVVINYDLDTVNYEHYRNDALVAAGFSSNEPGWMWAAWFYQNNVKVYSDGTFELNNYGSQPAEWSSAQVSEYNQVRAATGSNTMAMEAAMGLLTPDEEDEAKYGRMGAGGTQWAYLYVFGVVLPEFVNDGGGGGNQNGE